MQICGRSLERARGSGPRGGEGGGTFSDRLRGTEVDQPRGGFGLEC